MGQNALQPKDTEPKPRKRRRRPPQTATPPPVSDLDVLRRIFHAGPDPDKQARKAARKAKQAQDDKADDK